MLRVSQLNKVNIKIRLYYLKKLVYNLIKTFVIN